MIGRTILQRVTPDRMLARVLGALEGIGLASLAIGAVLVPVIVTVIGVQATLVVVGLILPVGVGVGWFRLTSMDRTTLIPTRALALLRAVPLFAPLAPPQLESVARRARWMTVEPGEIVIREGDTGDAYYVLESGELEFSQGATFLRESADWGYGFGEIALLRDVPRTATVTATRPSVLLTLGRADFLEVVTGHPQASRRRAAVAAVAGERRIGPATVVDAANDPGGRRSRPGRSRSSRRARWPRSPAQARPRPGRSGRPRRRPSVASGRVPAVARVRVGDERSVRRPVRRGKERREMARRRAVDPDRDDPRVVSEGDRLGDRLAGGGRSPRHGTGS